MKTPAMDTLERLIAEDACRTLVLLAAEYVDTQQPECLAALFAEDAVLRRPNGDPLIGRDAIRHAYAQRPPGRITRHLITNIIVTLELPDRARATSHALLWSTDAATEPGPFGRCAHPRQVLGEFADRFILTPDGWRLQHRKARFLMHSGD